MAGRTRKVAEGVWLVRGGLPLPTMNVYLIEDSGGGVTMFDAGVSSMVKSLRSACDDLGGLNRIVLGHAHVDHRGAAPGLDAPSTATRPRSPTPRATEASTTRTRACWLRRAGWSCPA